MTDAALGRWRVVNTLARTKRRAEKFNVPFDLTVEWYGAMWPPNGRCEVLPQIELEWGGGYEGRDSSPSIDRIRPELGYVQTNCRIISNRANLLKNNATAQEMRLVLADLEKHESAYH